MAVYKKSSEVVYRWVVALSQGLELERRTAEVMRVINI